MAKTVLIVDDNDFVRHALSELFKREADFEGGGEAENGVLDLSMPVMNGLDAARVLKRLMPTVPLIIFSEYSIPRDMALSPKSSLSATAATCRRSLD